MPALFDRLGYIKERRQKSVSDSLVISLDLRWTSKMTRLPKLFAFLLILTGSLTVASSTEACEEEISLGDNRYSVGDQWCGRKLDPVLRAKPAQLARLPDRLSHMDLGIYILREARDAFAEMAEAASEKGIPLHVKSGFRSARYQEEIILRRLKKGRLFENVIRYVAPPGYSEHESGRAVDLVSNHSPFHESNAYPWLKRNAARFGFRESYPENNGSPMPWEPWHWYYTGPENRETAIIAPEN